MSNDTMEHAARNAEIATSPTAQPMTDVERVYNEVMAVDNSAVYAARLDRLSGFQVTQTPENIEAAKKTRAALNALAKDAGASRMEVQRVIKAHPVGAFAFTKSALETKIEKEAKRLSADIERAENAPRVQLAEKVETFVCFITGTLAQVNALSVEANGRGLRFENRGPYVDETAGANGANANIL